MLSTVIHSTLPDAQVMFRSIRPGKPRIWVTNPYRRQQPGHWASAFRLVGHMATTTFVFLSLIILVSMASFVMHVLQSTKLVSADALRVFALLEVVLIHVDAAACGIVLLFGIGRYVLKVMKGDP